MIEGSPECESTLLIRSGGCGFVCYVRKIQGKWCLGQSNKLTKRSLERYLNGCKWSRGREKSIAVIRMQNVEILMRVTHLG